MNHKQTHTVTLLKHHVRRLHVFAMLLLYA